MVGLILVVLVIIGTIIFVAKRYKDIKELSEGTDEMASMASIIRGGAKTFMKVEYQRIVIVVLIFATIFSLFIEKLSGITFLIGATMSSVVCILGMYSATYANVRTANRALETMSIAETVKVALTGGSISGLSVHAFGLLGLVAITVTHFITTGGFDIMEKGSGLVLSLGANPFLIRLSTYSLGCSIVAMFNRVAGGNYTKAADISSDILAKVRHDLPEDDSRVPNVMADFIGDNVNDIAGNCSDLNESAVAASISVMMIAGVIFRAHPGASVALLNSTILAPILIAGGGLLSCLLSILHVSTHKLSDNPSKDLDHATYFSAGGTTIIAAIVCLVLFSGQELYSEFVLGWASPLISVVLGIACGVGVGMSTEYYTSPNHRPTRELAQIAPEGTAFVITKGDAIGSRSVLIPAIMIGVAIFTAGKISGIYGIAMAAMGMLSFIGTTVSIDAFGPIADNAGGIAESCHLPHSVRVITDLLDETGNVTAAVGKGFAICSAQLASSSLLIAYIGNYTTIGTEPILNIAQYAVIAGGVVGAALIEYFAAMLTDNTIDSAKTMADDGDKMMTPDVISGKVKPDYNHMVKLATENAHNKMLMPSLLATFVPVIGGFLFGVDFIGGILVGSIFVAVTRAIFMGNSGGAFDNAKKYIEQGRLEGYGKGSAAHKASVNGDTVGDTRKDVVGVALDIFIKMMSTVANTLAPLFSNFTIFR